MATRTILSPGVEIFEKDISLIAPQNVGTNVFITGYASQGPTDEVLMISSRSELDQIYGTPTNSAERYFYHGIRELLNSPAHIYTFRLPYGAGSGVGFGSQYSVLAYPVAWIKTDVLDPSLALSAASPTLSSYVLSGFTPQYGLDQTSGTYVLGNPVQFNLDETQYIQLMEGSLFTWSASGSNRSTFVDLSALANAGLLVVNKAQTTINNQFEGYYVGLADNSNINPATNFDAIVGAKTVSVSSAHTSNFTSIPNGTFQFQLCSTPFGQNSNSVSYVMENLTDFNIDGVQDDDLLNVGVFKLRKALYATESYKLDYVLESGIVGSIDWFRTKPNQSGGPQVSFFLENQDSNDRNIEIFVNPYISNKFGATAVGPDGIPAKKIRVFTHSLANSVSTLTLTATNRFGVLAPYVPALASSIGYADNLYPVGAYSGTQLASKELGSIPAKVERALEAVKNDEIYDIDVVVEAGLGSIYVATNAMGTTSYDDTAYPKSLSDAMQTLRTSNALDDDGDNVRADYSTIFNLFENFCNLPSNTGGRGDCVFIADPLRHILVTGKNSKILSDRTRTFQTDVYWAIRHQFELENSSYAAVYGNWSQFYDEFLGDKIWVPFSPVAATIFARSDAAEFPWSAPAGYNRGLVNGYTVDLAITPNQKQRDELYKANINPVLFSPSQGMAIFGQKTLQRKPSAFDRINVRRCFLALERPTKKASVFFVFEPNNEFTRARFVNTIKPIFEYAKNNGGVYDYLIVCDERNNTPQVIDSNELRADIYIKPTRTAEFIIVQFIATRTDANFEELIA